MLLCDPVWTCHTLLVCSLPKFNLKKVQEYFKNFQRQSKYHDTLLLWFWGDYVQGFIQSKLSWSLLFSVPPPSLWSAIRERTTTTDQKSWYVGFVFTTFVYHNTLKPAMVVALRDSERLEDVLRLCHKYGCDFEFIFFTVLYCRYSKYCVYSA